MSGSVIKKDGALRVALDWEVDVIDPPASFGGWNTGRVVQQTHESLVEDDLNTEGLPITRIVSALAESYEMSNDGLSYTFSLRKGVKFHDGAPFNAESVKFNIDRMWNQEAPHYSHVANDYNQVAVRCIKNVSIVDSHIVKVNLSEPFPEFIRYMTQEDAPGAFVFISPEAIKKYGNKNIGDIAPGTGPFMFHERFDSEHGSGVTLVRNPDYWGKSPHLDSIKFIPIPDAMDRASALERGDVDLAYGAHPKQLDSLREQGFFISKSTVPYVWYFSFNMNESPYNHPNVRKAIASGIDRANMAQKLFGSGAKPANGIIPPASPSFEEDLPEFYPYDPEKARSLLAEAGYSNGINLKLQIAKAGSGQLDPVGICDYISKDLSKIGISVEVVVKDDWVSYCEDWHQGIPAGISASEMSWGMSCDIWLEQVLHTRYMSPKGFNTGYYSNKEVDQLLDQARIELVESRRIELYRAAHRIIMKDLPVLPLLTLGDGLVVHNKRVKNFNDPVQNWHDFKHIQLV